MAFKFFRIEKDDGEGIYVKNQVFVKRYFNHHNDSFGFRSNPYQDFKLAFGDYKVFDEGDFEHMHEEYMDIDKFIISKNFLCAFASIKQLLNWFDRPNDLKILHEYGYKLKIYTHDGAIDPNRILIFDHQMIFDKKYLQIFKVDDSIALNRLLYRISKDVKI